MYFIKVTSVVLYTINGSSAYSASGCTIILSCTLLYRVTSVVLLLLIVVLVVEPSHDHACTVGTQCCITILSLSSGASG